MESAGPIAVRHGSMGSALFSHLRIQGFEAAQLRAAVASGKLRHFIRVSAPSMTELSSADLPRGGYTSMSIVICTS